MRVKFGPLGIGRDEDKSHTHHTFNQQWGLSLDLFKIEH